MHKGSGEGSWTLDGVVGVASHRVSSPWWAGGLVAEAAAPSPGEQAPSLRLFRVLRALRNHLQVELEGAPDLQ